MNKKRRTLHQKTKTTNPVDIWWACSIFVQMALAIDDRITEKRHVQLL